MADIRINALATTAASTASDDFIAVDGSANGTRKLNAFSPTFGGNLTVSGTGTSTFGPGSGSPSLIVSGGSGAGVGASIGFKTDGAFIGSMGRASVTDGGSGADFQIQSQGGVHMRIGANGAQNLYLQTNNTARVTIAHTTGDVTAAGNLTVSGGTITSGSGTLTLNSSANTVVLQSAGTTALTLDSSQNATFAGRGQFSAQVTISKTDNPALLLRKTAATAVDWYLQYNTDGVELYGGTTPKSCFRVLDTGNATFAGTIKPQQAATASAPSYVKGAIYFDTTLDKLRVGGATGWETITSV